MVAFIFGDIIVFVMCVTTSKECKRKMGCHVVVTEATVSVHYIRCQWYVVDGMV